MNANNLPLVSCLMPTYDRRAFVPQAIRYFLRQDYPHKELIIVDDGPDCIRDLVPEDPQIRYFRLDRKITLGAKLNLACSHASGGILAHWDDDDWYAPHRLRYQVAALQQSDAEVCGLNTLLYYDLRRRRAFRYVYPPEQRVWLIGSSLCYTRALWQRVRFAEIDVGMDGLFVWSTPRRQVRVLDDPTVAVHMIHGANVSPKKTEGPWWHDHAVEELERIVGADWPWYAGWPASAANSLAAPARVRNVYACLLHEKPDCAVDLVRNLRHFDRDAAIVLYNGGTDPQLLDRVADWEQLGATVHPHPRPQRHGYLHTFALDCMAYALEHFAFDYLTIVDSDQLALRPGYGDFLARYLADRPGVGLLSSYAPRITATDRDHHVARQALEEYELWKPLLDSFPNGDAAFVHWTFWPGTVFVRPAVHDLVRLFRENSVLQSIMEQTRIWATEEVIFPTLVRLLGYAIAPNPCSMDFVRYRYAFSPQHLGQALKNPAAFWMHPVERRYDHPLRAAIRRSAAGYAPRPVDAGPPPPFSLLDLLARVERLPGWLSAREADLLVAATFKACVAGGGAVVEVGCFHGKATVALAAVVQAFFPGVRVVAVDPHDGRQGAADQTVHHYAPTLEAFENNLQAAGVAGVVEIVRGRAAEVDWHGPVALLVIDGLHDYPSVASDFNAFAPGVPVGGYVAFHDYAAYFPGVQRFVDELVAGGTFCRWAAAESLVVLCRTAP